MTESYAIQTPEVQVEIIRALKRSKDQRCVDFLKKELINHPFPKLKILAAETLFSLGHRDYLISLVDDESSSEQLVQIIKHSMQEKVW